ncbi:uncharacterized protein [Triticum aestivum]|uniref:uncharacterized protein isoform X5 n=1 Tax=Triticum aestivum TaxID=4565 RepID=UPI001D01D32B|nr:uncharacterized protein LOC123119060 isoform X5 [Triticum aestivum]
MKIDALVAGVGVLIFSSKRRSSGMGATLLKGQGFIVCTHIKEKLGMFLCSDLVRKYYIMQFPMASPDELHAQRRRLHRFPEEQQDTFEFVADELSILRKRLRSMVVVEKSSLWNRKSNSVPRLICSRLEKKSKEILGKFKKIQFFWVVDNLMREVRSKFQLIWTSDKLSAKNTNRVKTVREQ